jgi:hypothetical protein
MPAHRRADFEKTHPEFWSCAIGDMVRLCCYLSRMYHIRVDWLGGGQGQFNDRVYRPVYPSNTNMQSGVHEMWARNLIKLLFGEMSSFHGELTPLNRKTLANTIRTCLGEKAEFYEGTSVSLYEVRIEPFRFSQVVLDWYVAPDEPSSKPSGRNAHGVR